MKKILSKFSVACITVFGLFMATSCELGLQKKFDFVPETTNLRTFKDQNAWEFIQKQTSDNPLALQTDKLDLFIQAVKLVGLEAEYSKPGNNRTFLMFNNAAFNGTGKIIQVVTGSTTGKLENANKVKLTNLLKYHIVEAYVDQKEALPVYGTNYTFQTSIPGEEGMIVFRRDERYSVTINDSPELPTTRKSAGIRNHNFIFGNGIGHVLQDYVRRTPF